MENFLLQAVIVSCLVINFSQSRRLGIVGGENVDIRDHPYMAVFLVNNVFKCGASILSETWCLTAAHCPYAFPTGISVRVGSTLRDSGGQLIPVSKAIIHPNFDRQRLWNDIALLQLSREIIFGLTVQPVKLGKCSEEIPVDTECVVNGWGKLSTSGSTSKLLMSVKVFIVDFETCKQNYMTDPVKFPLHSTMMCAGVPEGGKDSCSGDSGGPMLVDGIQIAIVSSGYNCAVKGYPGIYCNVTQYCNFIQEVTKLDIFR